MYIFLILLLLCACGDTIENHYTITGTGPDASTDVDAQPDAAPETATDATITDTVTEDTRAQPDVEIDAQEDVPADTAADVVVDTAPDTVPDVVDAAPDTGDGGDANACSGGRYIVTEKDDGSFGSGRFVDTKTGFTWTRHQYPPSSYKNATDFCNSLGMKIPSKDEALSIVGVPTCAIAWSQWATWTQGWSWDGKFTWYDVVWYSGYISKTMASESAFSFCVRIK